MDTKVTEKVFEYIDALALKLGVASEHVYGVLVKQAVVSGMVNGIVLTVIPLVFLLVTIILARQVKWKSSSYQSEKEESFTMASIGFGIFFLLTFLIFCLFAPDQYIKIFNPEYFAIKEILSVIK